MKKIIISLFGLLVSISTFAGVATIDNAGNILTYELTIGGKCITFTGTGPELEQRITIPVTNLYNGTYMVCITNGSVVTTNMVPVTSTNVHTSVFTESVSINTNTLNNVQMIEVTVQTLKPLELLVLENNYFIFQKQCLTLAEDPRSLLPLDQLPKLDTDEMKTIMMIATSLHPNEAVVLSLQGLLIDGQLRRYNILWWDTAIWHSNIGM